MRTSKMQKGNAGKKKPASTDRKVAPRRRRGLKVGLVLLALLAVGSLLLVWKIDADIRDAMEGPTWEVPSLVFAEPVKLYPGLEWSRDEVESVLLDLRYVRQKGAKAPGTYDGSNSGFSVHLRPLEMPDRRREALLVTVSFAGPGVLEITGPGGQALASVETEAPKITGFYGAQRQARDPIRLADVPAILKDAVLLVEDKRFYEHWGLDPRGILRALWTDVRARGAVQGGSTVTQQLAKNLFFSHQKTWRRKLAEAAYALRLERLYGKDVILQAYLNEVYLGADRGVQIGGVAEGSRHYFGLDMRDIDLPRAALLAGLIRGPGNYDPFRKPAEARARRRVVLDLLWKEGRISDKERDAAERAPLGIRKARGPTAAGSSAYVDSVRSQLGEHYSPAALATSGLRIFTPLDPKIQGAAQEALDTVLEGIEKARKLAPGALEGAVVVLEPGTGAVRALVGGRGGIPGTFNRAVQARRQPGSLMKPFAYAAALASRRFTAASLLSDTPIELSGKEGPWRPVNADGLFRGDVTLRRALEESLNVPSVRLLQATGPSAAMDVARKAGITSPLTKDYSVVLGTSEVTPLEIATAFATFASGGQWSEPRFLRGVISRSGEVLQEHGERSRQVLPPDLAYVVNDLLRGACLRGTARALSGYAETYPLSAKTGTTSGGRDAWFVGYTSRFLALVWVGSDEPRNLNLAGASTALPVWRRLVQRLPGILSAPQPQSPPGLVQGTIDPETGLLASSGCSQHFEEWFLEGTEPSEFCPHGSPWDRPFEWEGGSGIDRTHPAAPHRPPRPDDLTFYTP
jgi:penicillin-binding protein 1B